MRSRTTGSLLAAAAALFWVAWVLMPGVGVTDAAQIFALVGSQRPLVSISVAVQLVSAVLYVPAMLGLVREPALGEQRSVRIAAGLLLVGALGSAADAVLHLLAFAMTAPGVDRVAMLPVMAFMQGPGLQLLGPLIVCLFAGGAWLSIALYRTGAVSKQNAWLHLWALVVALVGGGLAARGLVSGRVVGLLVLGLISAAQAWAGMGVRRLQTVASLRSAEAYPGLESTRREHAS